MNEDPLRGCAYWFILAGCLWVVLFAVAALIVSRFVS